MTYASSPEPVLMDGLFASSRPMSASHDPDRHPYGDRAQILQQALLGEQDRGPRILQYVGHAIGGIHWIQWDIGPARLEDPQQRHQHRWRPFQKNSHQHARTYAHPAQIVRELVG